MIEEQVKKTFMCMFHGLIDNSYGLNITTPTDSIEFILDKDNENPLAGGILTDKNARALRDFLNEYLKELRSEVNENFRWETILDNEFSETERAPVIGGWLVCRAEINYTMETEIQASKDHRAITMTFVPDFNHEWEI